MKFFSVARFAVLAATIAPTSAAFAQGLSISDVVNGKFPVKMAISDMPDTFRAAKIISSGPVPDPMTSLMPLMMLNSGGAGVPSFELIKILDDSWTDGSVVTMEGQRFLVTYRLDGSLIDIMRQNAVHSGAAGGPPPVPVSQSLKLLLVKVDGIQSISPDPDITKQKLLEFVAPVTAPAEQAEHATTAPASPAASQAETVSNLKQVALGTIMYTSDYDDVYPWAQSTKAVKYVTAPYLKNDAIWATFNPNGGEILFNMALGGASCTSLENPAQTVLFYESKTWPNGTRVVAYADGHVKVEDAQQWARVSKTLTAKFPKTAKRPLPLNYGMTVAK